MQDLVLGKTPLPVGARMSETALELPDGLDFDAWCEIGDSLTRLESLSAWLIGDWVRYGQWAYGRRYEEALELTGLSYQTLRNRSYVCGRIGVSLRRYKLSFTHHAEIAALTVPEQERWLDLAESRGYTVAQLREAIAGAKEAREAEPTDPPDPRSSSELVHGLRFSRYRYPLGSGDVVCLDCIVEPDAAEIERILVAAEQLVLVMNSISTNTRLVQLGPAANILPPPR